MNQKDYREGAQKLKTSLKNGEKKEIFIPTWHDHVKNKDEIESFTTLASEKIYHIIPKVDEVFIPFSEYHGDHDNCWILALDKKTNKELFRKNIKTVDMVTWKLLSSPTNS